MVEENNKNDSEFALFGFVTRQLRMGFVTAIIGILLFAVGYLWRDNKILNEQIRIQQQELINKLLREEIKPVLKDVQNKVDDAASRVDTAVEQVQQITNKNKKQ